MFDLRAFKRAVAPKKSYHSDSGLALEFTSGLALEFTSTSRNETTVEPRWIQEVRGE